MYKTTAVKTDIRFGPIGMYSARIWKQASLSFLLHSSNAGLYLQLHINRTVRFGAIMRTGVAGSGVRFKPDAA
jgi:hypothetical protein